MLLIPDEAGLYGLHVCILRPWMCVTAIYGVNEWRGRFCVSNNFTRRTGTVQQLYLMRCGCSIFFSQWLAPVVLFVVPWQQVKHRKRLGCENTHTRTYDFIRLEAYHYILELKQDRSRNPDLLFSRKDKHYTLVGFYLPRRKAKAVRYIRREALVLWDWVLPGILSKKERDIISTGEFNGIKVGHYNCRCNIGCTMAVAS